MWDKKGFTVCRFIWFSAILISFIIAPIDDDIEDDYDDDVFDTKEDPQPEPKKIPAKRRSQSLSALKDKEEKSPKKVLT